MMVEQLSWVLGLRRFGVLFWKATMCLWMDWSTKLEMNMVHIFRARFGSLEISFVPTKANPPVKEFELIDMMSCTLPRTYMFFVKIFCLWILMPSVQSHGHNTMISRPDIVKKPRVFYVRSGCHTSLGPPPQIPPWIARWCSHTSHDPPPTIKQQPPHAQWRRKGSVAANSPGLFSAAHVSVE
jgi:hypothetical protein